MILRLKSTPGLYLVGFMGSGKTTVGRALAGELGWTFVDLDDDIEARAGRTIQQVFDAGGEEAFRAAEREALEGRVREIRNGRPTVLALGGGAFVDPGNAELIGANGVSIWLDCSFERIERRVAGSTHRPLARDPAAFAALYQSRRAAYSRADHRIEIGSDDPAEAVAVILALEMFR